MEWLANRMSREAEIQKLQSLVNSQNEQIEQLKKSVEVLEIRQQAQDTGVKDCNRKADSILFWLKLLFWLFVLYAFITI